MEPEVADAIRIADKHLAGKSIERRKALAHEIAQAILRHAEPVARDLAEVAMSRMTRCANCVKCSCRQR